MSLVTFFFLLFGVFPDNGVLGIDFFRGQGGFVELSVDAGVGGHDWDYGDGLRALSTTLRFSLCSLPGRLDHTWMYDDG